MSSAPAAKRNFSWLNEPTVIKVICLLFALFLSLQWGLSYGIGTQATYLIDGLAKANSDWFQVDWYARSVLHYHDSFSAMVTAISQSPLPLAETTIVIDVVLRMIGMLAIFWIAKQLSGGVNTAMLFTVAMVAIYLAMTQGNSVGLSLIFNSYLQPASFAALSYLLGLALLIGKRYWLSGLVFGFGGYMHSNFLIAALMVLPFTHLLLGRDGLVKRAVIHLAPLSIVLIIKLPLIFAVGVSNPEMQDEAGRVIYQIGAWFHYYPLRFLPDFGPFFGWTLAGLSAYGLTKTPGFAERVLAAWVLPIVAVVAVATLLTTVVFLPMVAKLYVYRLAPFATLMAAVLLFATCARAPTSLYSLSTNRGKLAYAGIFGGFLLTVVSQLPVGIRPAVSYAWAFLIPLAVLAIRGVLNSRNRFDWWPAFFRPATALAYVLSFAAVLTVVYPGFIKRSTVLQEFPPKAEAELYQWAADTPTDSMFVIPGQLAQFRLFSHRSIVIDHFTFPLDFAGALEWYRRVAATSGVEDFDSVPEVTKKYRSMTPARMDALRDQYGADFIVLERDYLSADIKNAKNARPVAFQNEKYVVYRPSS